MPDKKPEAYKTEAQLREEARLRKELEAKSAAAQKPKSSFQKKFENYWYHYKWHTISAIVALFLIGVFVNDSLLRPRPDATIIMVSDRYFSPADIEEIQKNIEQVAWDRNGDGKTYILIDSNRLAPDLEDGGVPTESDYSAQMKLVAVVAAGAEPLYLVDEPAYDRLMQMGGQTQDGETINIFMPETAPADKLGAPEMTFYMRYGKTDDENYQYCLELLRVLNQQ